MSRKSAAHRELLYPHRVESKIVRPATRKGGQRDISPPRPRPADPLGPSLDHRSPADHTSHGERTPRGRDAFRQRRGGEKIYINLRRLLNGARLLDPRVSLPSEQAHSLGRGGGRGFNTKGSRLRNPKSPGRRIQPSVGDPGQNVRFNPSEIDGRPNAPPHTGLLDRLSCPAPTTKIYLRSGWFLKGRHTPRWKRLRRGVSPVERKTTRKVLI